MHINQSIVFIRIIKLNVKLRLDSFVFYFTGAADAEVVEYNYARRLSVIVFDNGKAG